MMVFNIIKPGNIVYWIILPHFHQNKLNLGKFSLFEMIDAPVWRINHDQNKTGYQMSDFGENPALNHTL